MSASRPSRSVGTPRLITASLPKPQPVRSFGSSRHSDGRNTLYHPPTREHHAGSKPYRPHRQSPRRPYHRSYRQPYWFNPWTFSYQHYGFMPFWHPQPYFYPYYYPQYYAYPACGFGFSWSSGSFGLSLFSYTPAYSTFYYDSWHCGGWGYSRIYHDCWRSGWYGGISYIYNPWPVYRTIYLYDTAPAVINAETVYVTEPSNVVYNTAQPASQTSVAAPAPAVWDSAPAEERAETLANRCFCRCGCNGQRPCVCEYPCGSEYAWQPEDFDLSLDYASYSETLDPETIWLSYANLDYLEADPRVFDRAATAFSR